MASIGIAGAGLLGRMTAWQLLRRGYGVTLFDADRREGVRSAGRIAAAMLAPYAEIPHGGQRVLELGRSALTRWPALMAALREDGGGEVPLHRDGSIAVAHAADRPDLHQLRNEIRRRLGAECDRVRDLDAEGLAALEPELAGRFDGGMHLAEEGYLVNETFYAALARAIDALAGSWRTETPIRAVTAGSIHLETGRRECFDLAIDARGAGARDAIPGLRGVRGEVLRVHAPEVALAHPVRLMHPRYQIYVVPRPQSRYVVGATEIESDAQTPVTVRSHLELLSGLYSLHPGFGEAAVEAANAGLRPAFADNLPRLRTAAGLIVANGLYRHGYLFAPLMTAALVDLVEDRPIRDDAMAALVEAA